MSVLQSRLNTRSDAFRANTAQMEAVVAELRAQVARTALGATRRPGRSIRPRQAAAARAAGAVARSGGAIPGAEPARAHGMYGGEVPAAGMITGIGRVSGRECVVVVNDAP